MHHSLQRRDPRDPPVEVVKRPKVPPRQPHQEVIPHAEEPDDGEAGPREDAGTVGDVAPYLLRGGGEAGAVSLLCSGERLGLLGVRRARTRDFLRKPYIPGR